MNRFSFILATLALLFACSPENNPGETKDNDADIIPEGAVDLGIVMKREDGTIYKLYWAKSNLSESGLCANPEDYGDYYAWGETEPYYSSLDPLTWKDGKTGYNWASYGLCNGGALTLTEYNTQNSYGTVDNKTVLDPEDDVAHVKLGGKWRMPTKREWIELLLHSIWSPTTQNGINGHLVTVSNGNSIFLPAAGYRDDAVLRNAGDTGYYWSSSLSTDNPSCYAWGVRGDNFYRYYGLPIRPVTE